MSINTELSTEKEAESIVTQQPCGDDTIAVSDNQSYVSDGKSKNFFEDKLKRFTVYLNPVTALMLCLIMIMSVVLVIVGISLFGLSSELDELRSSHRGVYNNSQSVVLSGESERIYTYNYAYGDVAIPAIPGVPKSMYKNENFQTDSNGFKYYYQDSELCSYVGVDVSEHNGSIDWNRVKDAGVDFVMLRIGGRGWGQEGIMYRDSSFSENLREAKEAGLMVGAYFFSQAITEEEAVEEAQYAIDILNGESLDYPLAFDWETIEGAESARTDNISPDTLTLCARAFCDTVKEANYIPCLYTGSTLAYYKYDLAQLADIDIWYAFYDDTPGLYYNYMIWQYSATGKVDGISGDVDLNICFKNYK